MNQNTVKQQNYNDDILLRKVIIIFFGRKWTSLLTKIEQIDQYRPMNVQNRPKSSKIGNFFKFFIQKKLIF